MNQQIEFNQVQINVQIENATIHLYDYEPIEGRRSLVFSMKIEQSTHKVICDETPLADKFCAICNDVFYSLMRHANTLWPLGKWSKQRGYGWHYMSTREDEVKLLKELSEKYYGRNN